jgi:SET family sugar efflux transporter-like MFS transporter
MEVVQDGGRHGAPPDGRFSGAWSNSAAYRPLVSLVLLSSFASFSSLSVLSLFAHGDVGATDTQVTLYFVVVALAGAAVMFVTGHISDRRGRRVLVAASLGWLAVGYWALAATRTYAQMLIVGVVFFSAVGVPNAQLLAYARELVQRQGDVASIAVIGLVRVVFSIGSFLGFAGGGLGLAFLGARSVFRVTGLLCLCCLAMSWRIVRHAAEPGEVPPKPGRAHADNPTGATSTTNDQRLLVLFAAAMVLFASGRVMQLAQLPILLHVSLHAPLELIGLILAVPPMCELVLMPVMAWAATRWGRGRIFLIGAAASVAYYAGLAFVASTWQLLLLQVLYAVFGAATVMIGIDLAQRLMTRRAGTATSTYLGHENVAVVHGSVVATLAVAALGHQAAFLVPATLCLIALTFAVGLFRRYPTPFDLRRPDAADARK